MADPTHWYVVVTEPQGEERARDGLLRAGLAVYLPLARYKVRSRNRRRKVDVVVRPLWRGYLFVAFPHRLDWEVVHATRGVAGFVCADRVPLRISAERVADVMAMEDMGLFDFTSPPPLKWRRGDRVVMTAGPLDGYVAVIARSPRAADDKIALDVIGTLCDDPRGEISVVPMRAAVTATVPIDNIRSLA